jgi:hypothetical protein
VIPEEMEFEVGAEAYMMECNRQLWNVSKVESPRFRINSVEWDGGLGGMLAQKTIGPHI